MTREIALGLVAVVLVWPIRAALLHARWADRAPRAAIVLWQAIGLAVGVAFVGACFEVAFSFSPGPSQRQNVTDFTAALATANGSQPVSPNELFGLTAGLIVVTLLVGSLVVRSVGLARARARQRLLIDLVGTARTEIPGVIVVDDPRAAAFGIPGLRARIVVSSGAVDALSDDELAAVLAHEHAHLRARHDLVLLPFRALSSSLPRSRSLAAVSDRVASLVEMAADDRALRVCKPCALVRALCTLSIVEPPFAGLNAASATTAARVERALGERRSARIAAFGSACSTLGVLALPLVALFAPFGGR